ncbi:unnamed protein product, partial [Porites lobata]
MTLRRVFIKSTATNQSPNGPFRQNLKSNKSINLLNVLKVSSGLVERTKELGIFDFKIKLQLLQYKRNVPEAEFPKGRIFAIDSQDQFEVARPLLQEKHELIGK